MPAEPVFPAWPARPWVRNSTPTRKARSRRSDGFTTALGAFRELFRELFPELSRRLSLESSRRKLTSSCSAGSGTRGHRLLMGRRRWLRIGVAVGPARDDDSRNRVLEDELLLVTGFENHRVLVEGSDTTRQLHPADQIDRNIVPFLSCRVEEGILNILLCRLSFHLPISLFAGSRPRHELREGNGGSSVSIGSYNTALSRAFQLPTQQKFFRPLSSPGAPNGSFPSIPGPSIKFHFPGQPSTIVRSGAEFKNRSPNHDPDQLSYRLQHKPSDAVSLAAFRRRHNLGRLALFL